MKNLIQNHFLKIYLCAFVLNIYIYVISCNHNIYGIFDMSFHNRMLNDSPFVISDLLVVRKSGAQSPQVLWRINDNTGNYITEMVLLLDKNPYRPLWRKHHLPLAHRRAPVAMATWRACASLSRASWIWLAAERDVSFSQRRLTSSTSAATDSTGSTASRPIKFCSVRWTCRS